MRDFTGMNAESVYQTAGIQIPEANSEVDTAGHQIIFIVTAMLSMRIQQAVNPSIVTGEYLMRRPIYKKKYANRNTFLFFFLFSLTKVLLMSSK